VSYSIERTTGLGGMSEVKATGPAAASVVVEAVIIRADGTREDLGRVAYWHRNPIRRWLWRLSKEGRR
jgi:hypothetical protein